MKNLKISNIDNDNLKKPILTVIPISPGTTIAHPPPHIMSFPPNPNTQLETLTLTVSPNASGELLISQFQFILTSTMGFNFYVVQKSDPLHFPISKQGGNYDFAVVSNTLVIYTLVS